MISANRFFALPAVTALLVPASLGVSARGPSPTTSDPFVMTATSYTSGYSPSYVGNGYVGTRIPAQGMGYVAGATVPTTTIVSGVWEQTSSQDVVSAAPLPGWDELRFSDAGTDYSLSAGGVANWQQSLDMKTGVISTSLDWTSPAGHTTHLVYDVLADLAHPHIATVRLRLTPQWSGSATVSDVLGSGASTDLVPVSSSANPGHRSVTLAVRTPGTNVTVAYASHLGFTVKPLSMVATKGPRNAALGVSFAVQPGSTYEFSKAVGIATSQDSANPPATAVNQSDAANAAGFAGTLSADASAWADRWQTDIVLPDDPAMQQRIRAAEFYLQESIRPGQQLEHLAGGPVLERLQRPHLLGRRDMDVPVFAPAPSPRRRQRGELPQPYPRGGADQCSADRIPGCSLRLGECERRDRADPDLRRDPRVRAAHHVRRRTRPMAVLPRHG